MAEHLYSLWLDVYDAAVQHDDPWFQSALSVFTSWYKKANIQEQGDYHQLVSVFMKS